MQMITVLRRSLESALEPKDSLGVKFEEALTRQPETLRVNQNRRRNRGQPRQLLHPDTYYANFQVRTLAGDAGVAEGIPAGLGPHAEAVRFAADLDGP